jgi:translocation and assembly module TamA
MANYSNPGALRRTLLLMGLLAAFLPASPAYGKPLEIVVQGVEEPLLSNVQARTQSFRVSGNTRLSRRRLERYREDAERRAGAALRPFGFYHATVSSGLHSTGDGNWEITLQIDPGPAVIITQYRVDISGPGKNDQSLLGWKDNWPLTSGTVLNQATWEEQKETALGLAEAHGYLGASFSEKVIELDLEQNQASLSLLLETGEQAVMGLIEFKQDLVDTAVLENLARFSDGQPYDAWLLEQFRLDLWRTGYFENIEVVEERRLEESPPRVNLLITMEPRKRNTYQGSFGFGSDTGIRMQAMWSRHLLSSRGDSLDVGVGWQDTHNELSFRTIYRQPRRVAARQYWTAELQFRTENQDFKVRPSEEPRELVTIARGNVDDYSFKPGWLRILDRKRGYRQVFERWYVQYLRERSSFSPVEEAAPEYSVLLRSGDQLQEVSRPSESFSFGVSWNWPHIRGNAFETVGHNHRVQVFTSNTAWGSDLDFSQAYVSSRWNTIWRDRWKFLWRGEIGYSDAHVDERFVETEGGEIGLSVTELPYAYRFKAGGSQSVRGYGFEELSNNNIGSNNIVIASAELEFRFLEKWSAAVFFDVGNAFNEWDAMKLNKGAGVGIRWYSIAGPIRLDFAQALDEPGKPWRIHFTIGSPLL